MSAPLPLTVQTAAAPVPVTLVSPAAPGPPMSSWTHPAGAPETGGGAAWAGRGALTVQASAPASSHKDCLCILCFPPLFLRNVRILKPDRKKRARWVEPDDTLKRLFDARWE